MVQGPTEHDLFLVKLNGIEHTLEREDAIQLFLQLARKVARARIDSLYFTVDPVLAEIPQPEFLRLQERCRSRMESLKEAKRMVQASQ